MTVKTYIAQTALILQDATGRDFRIEAGEAVALTPEQYQDVAAHVTPQETGALADVPESDTQQEDGGSHTDGEPQTETGQQPEAKPARGRKPKAE